MPLPLFLGIAAGIAAAGGIGSGIHGAVKMKDAKDTMKCAEERHNKNMQKFKSTNTKTTKCMDNLGKKEIEILSSFEKFSELFEKIQNKPEFADVTINGNVLPKYDGEELKKVSVGACALMGGLGGAALGTAGGFAAAGATTAAVMALGTASTGTAIASLSGAAATNATLAALGGGAVAAGGGGIALGTTVLGAATAGVGLLVGGIIFSITGSSISNKADEAYSQMKKAEAQINEICAYLNELKETATKYNYTLCEVDLLYQDHLLQLEGLVNEQNKTDWLLYSEEEKLLVQNTILLVGLLYKMCKVQLVIKSGKNSDMNKINYDDINEAQNSANNVLEQFSIVETGYYYNELHFRAMLAVIVYFSQCDGDISNEEHEILMNIVNDLPEKTDSTNEIIDEIFSISNFTFDILKNYLEPIKTKDLLEFRNLVNSVISASDGISTKEMIAKMEFDKYVLAR